MGPEVTLDEEAIRRHMERYGGGEGAASGGGMEGSDGAKDEGEGGAGGEGRGDRGAARVVVESDSMGGTT
jgi:hypothetical protein